MKEIKSTDNGFMVIENGVTVEEFDIDKAFDKLFENYQKVEELVSFI